MPSTFKDAEGNDVSAFTVEEVNAKDEAIQKANDEMARITEELNKMKEKDLNFSKLREQKDSLEGKVKQIETDFTAKLETTKKELFEGVLKDHYNDVITNLASGDEETKKKIAYHYNRLSDKAETKAEVDKKLKDAWALAQDKPASNAAAAFSSGGMGYVKPSSGTKTFSKEEVELGKAIAAAGGMKLDDKDFNK